MNDRTRAWLPEQAGARIRFVRASVPAPHFFDFLDQRRNYFKQIADNTVITIFKYGRFRIVVYGYNRFCRAHSRQMLNRTGYASSDIQVGTDHFSGLADLVRLSDPTRIHRGPACAERGAQGVT